MKIAHIGDTHLGMVNYTKANPLYGANERLLDYKKCLTFAVDTIIEREVEAVLFVGDAYKNRFPDATQKWYFEEEILRLIQHGIYVVCVVGNHDSRGIEGANSSLDSLKMLQGGDEMVTVFSTPGDMFLTNTTTFGDVHISAMPWPSRKFLFDDPEQYKLSADKMYALLKEKVDEKLHAMNVTAHQSACSSKILIGHLDVDEAEYSSEQTMVVKANLITELSLLQQLDAYGYIGLGHIHKHQNIGTSLTPIVYCGSIERVDLSEENDDKGFCIFDIEDNQLTSFEFIKTPARRMTTIEMNLTEDPLPTLTLAKELETRTVDGIICRIKYTTDPGVGIEWSKLKEFTDRMFHWSAIKKPSKQLRQQGYIIEHTNLKETLTTYLEDKDLCQNDAEVQEVLALAQTLMVVE